VSTVDGELDRRAARTPIGAATTALPHRLAARLVADDDHARVSGIARRRAT